MSPVPDAERLARIVLSHVVEPGDADACRLVAQWSAIELLDRITSAGATCGPRLLGWRERTGAVDRDALLAAADEVDARYVCPGDAEWPDRLGPSGLAGLALSGDRRGGPPFGLWLRGQGDLARLAASSVAIVGSRASTPYGDRVAGQLAHGCAGGEVITVSGGAYGIDGAAHRGALAADRPTIAVLASGVDRLYPSGHAALLRRIADDGIVVSEAAPGAAARKARFLTRNRLIAALTGGTVVVEAALRSGSLNTARWAADLGRPVMGVPGPVTSAMSAGVHELLRQTDAVIVTDPAEVLEQISPIGTRLAPAKRGARRPADALGDQAALVLDVVRDLAPATVGDVARECGLSPSVTAEVLVDLDAAGFVERRCDGWVLGAGG